MASLLLALHGPMQSWGVGAKLGVRTTAAVPTRSAVLGLLAAGAGVPRTDRSSEHDAYLSSVTALALLVRVDRPGVVVEDLHNITAGARQGKDGVYQATIQSRRHYLADAAFVAALSGDRGVLDEVAAALAAPRWQLSLGRRSCPPAYPFLLGVTDLDARDALEQLPALGRGRLRVVAPYGLVGDRQGWAPGRSELSATNPVHGEGRVWSTERTEAFDISAAHTGVVVGDPVELLQAAAGLSGPVPA